MKLFRNSTKIRYFIIDIFLSPLEVYCITYASFCLFVTIQLMELRIRQYRANTLELKVTPKANSARLNVTNFFHRLKQEKNADTVHFIVFFYESLRSGYLELLMIPH